MPFAPGDAVHVRSVGKGIVREVRNNGRLLVEVNGRSIVTTEDQVTVLPAEKRRARAAPRRTAPAVDRAPSEAALSLDLHGLTVDEAHDAVLAFIDRALRAGASEVHFIHGRSGGRLKAALHSQLKRIPAVKSYALDPRNPGVTIVRM